MLLISVIIEWKTCVVYQQLLETENSKTQIMVSEWLKSITSSSRFCIVSKTIGTNKKPWIKWGHTHLAVCFAFLFFFQEYVITTTIIIYELDDCLLDISESPKVCGMPHLLSNTYLLYFWLCCGLKNLHDICDV